MVGAIPVWAGDAVGGTVGLGWCIWGGGKWVRCLSQGGWGDEKGEDY
jgi:hypothetical protein